MKKIFIVILFIGLVLLSGRVFGDQIGCTNTCQPGETQSAPPACVCNPGQGTQGNTNNTGNNNTGRCDPAKIYRLPGGGTGCCPGVLDDSGHCDTSLTDVGINISTDCLLNGQCSLNIYKVLGIRKSNQNPTVLGFFQDITLATTTAILGTVMIMAIIISGLFFAFASITGQEAKRAKTILIDAFVGLLMVMGSYAIIRLIQFLATAGS